MKVLNLQCEHQHSFEGWFASEDDYRQQLDSGLLACPLCGSPKVEKTLSAPRLNLKSPRGAPDAPGAAHPNSAAAAARSPSAAQARWMTAVRQIMDKAEDVGERFPDEVRAMHQGDMPHRAVRGQTSLSQAQELLEEGIDIVPLPDLDAFKNTLQ